MGSAKAKTVRGNVVQPQPEAPKEYDSASSELLDRKVKVDEKPRGTIEISIYEGKPYKAKFAGQITGTDITIAWRAMYKQYKLWKRELLKQGGK